MRFFLKNTLGAFSDGAVLFPLMAVLSLQGGFSGTTLLLSSGFLYLAAAFVFRVPMSVQPLKSIAIASVAVGASLSEIRLSGAVLGVVCLFLAHSKVIQIFHLIPKSLIHCLQVGLGAILIMQSTRWGFSALSLALIIVILVLPGEWAVLGMIATAGLIWGFISVRADLHQISVSQKSWIRPEILLSLVLPQVVLTLANSVVSTRDVAERYFGPKAERVTHRALLQSIGIGNLITAGIGGLPFCHGSGGVTAHYRGGSTHWVSNVIVGSTLLALAGIHFITGNWALNFPTAVLSALLFATGIFHMMLAKPTWESLGGKIKVLLALVTGLLTQNMLMVLGVALVCEFRTLRERRTT